MNLEKALQQAVIIANVLIDGSNRLGEQKFGELPLLAGLSVHTAAASKNVKSFDPRVMEIIIFGSVARGEAYPNDIDMMIFDGGFYSNILGFMPKEAHGEIEGKDNRPRSSWGEMLQDNLHQLITGWFGFDESVSERITREVTVDMQVLPVTLITSVEKRNEVGAAHSDSRFFENAFSKLLRYDRDARRYVPTTISELEEKYRNVPVEA